jgi:hypothetical protein
MFDLFGFRSELKEAGGGLISYAKQRFARRRIVRYLAHLSDDQRGALEATFDLTRGVADRPVYWEPNDGRSCPVLLSSAFSWTREPSARSSTSWLVDSGTVSLPGSTVICRSILTSSALASDRARTCPRRDHAGDLSTDSRAPGTDPCVAGVAGENTKGQ